MNGGLVITVFSFNLSDVEIRYTSAWDDHASTGKPLDYRNFVCGKNYYNFSVEDKISIWPLKTHPKTTCFSVLCLLQFFNLRQPAALIIKCPSQPLDAIGFHPTIVLNVDKKAWFVATVAT